MTGSSFLEGGLASGCVKVIVGQSAIRHPKGNDVLLEFET